MVECYTCLKSGTMECPNSSLCYSIETKPFWEPIKYRGKEVFLFCPNCDLKFSEGDQIRMERGLKVCPNCMVELERIQTHAYKHVTLTPIQLGMTPDFIIVDEFANAQDIEKAVNHKKMYEIYRAYEYVAQNISKNGDENTLEVCIISDLLRIIRNHDK